VILCGLVLAAYSNSFRGGFVLDNRALILDDARVHQASIDNLSNIANHSYWWPVFESGLYRPVTTVSYLFNYAILGNADRPAGYHAVNLLLHLANVLLVLAIGWRLSRNIWLAGLIAAVWAVHPLGTEAVTNIVGRADLLAALGSLTALFAHLEARDAVGSRKLPWLLMVMVAVAIGVFSKESAVAVIAVAMLYDIVVLEGRISTPALLTGWMPFVLPLALMWYQRSAVLGDTAAMGFPFVDNPIVAARFWQGRLTAVAVAARYLWLIVWPAGLSPDYSFSQIPLVTGTAQEWLAWGTVAAFVVVTTLLWRLQRPVALVMIAAVVMFLPASNLAFATGTIMAERLVYLPSIGVIAALVAAVFAAARRWQAPAAVPIALLGVITLALAARTWIRNPDWNSEVSLWTSAAATAPNSFKTHGALAEALYNADPSHSNMASVIAEKERSLAILSSLPDSASPALPHREAATYYLEFGDWLVQHGQTGSAPEVTAAYRNAANAADRFLALAGQQKGASARDITAAQMIASSAYQRLNEGKGAVAAGRNAVATEPFNPRAYQVAAAAFVSAGQHDDAAVALMSGFIVTGDQELRSLLVTLYRSGLDTERCAVSSTPRGDVLNPACGLVARHLCAAGQHAMAVHRQNGRPDLAEQIQATTLHGLGCPADSSTRITR
jgi:hypothetical protein